MKLLTCLILLILASLQVQSQITSAANSVTFDKEAGAKLYKRDSLRELQLLSMLGRAGADSVTILLLQKEITALRSQGNTYQQLDSTRQAQIGLYKRGEDTLLQRLAVANKAAKKANNRTKGVSIIWILITVGIVLLK